MWIRDKVYLYISITIFCLVSLAGLVVFDHLSYDKAHFAQQIEKNVQDLEVASLNNVKDGDWISQIRSVQSSGKILSNDLVNQIEKLSQEPYTIYLYHKDSLIFWSKPGSIIDPSHKEFKNIPGVFPDHRQDYYIKHAELADHQDLLQVYFKIPIIPAQEQAYSIRVTPYKFGHPSPDNATTIRSVDGSPIAHVQLLTKEFSFFLQCIIFVLCLVAIWSLCMTWISRIQHIPDQKVSHVNKILLQMLGVLGIRMATLFLPYHDFFDQISLLSPIIQNISFPYSTTDLLLDSSIFLWLCTLASKIYSRDLLFSTSIPVSNKRWADRLMTMGHYLVVIMMCGLTAWILRQVVGQSNFRLDLGEISLFDIHHFLSIMACGLIIMGVFTFSFQIVNRAIFYTKNFYERMIALLFAGVLSLPLLKLIEIDLPNVGFYLGVFILMTLLDLYIEQGNKSVIWVLSWLVTISSMTALVLYKYQKDFEKIARTELIQEAPDGYGHKENFEEKLIEWFSRVPNKYSLGFYHEGQLVFNNRYDYALVFSKPAIMVKHKFTELKTSDDRTDVALLDEEDNVIMLGKKVEGLNQVVSLFSLIFTVFSFLLFIIAGLNAIFEFLPQNMELTISPRPSLRNKIQIAIVCIIILTFTIVGLLTIYYIRSNSRADEIRRYDERLRTIAGSIRQTITSESTSFRKDMSQAAKIAVANSASNQIYDPDGNLIHQQDDKGNNETNIPFKLAFLPKMILDAGSRDYYLSGTHLDEDGVSRFGDVGYVSIHKGNGKSGYIELTELFPSGSESGDPGTAFFMTLLNAYVFIFLLAICVAVFMARSITGPVAQLSEKLKKIRLGKKNETIQWSIDDEVGELIRDYNGMVTKLDESALMLAQTERDTAWREMAKQVAHEIKNPLTPMKLSIQYLENAATKTEESNLPGMIKRVSKTLIEQIDNLTHIASEFSSYAKMPQAMNEVFVINDVVASVHDLFRKREDMDIQLQVPINDLFVFADKSQIIRVLNNIVKNAIQSIPRSRRGLIHIKLVFTDDQITISIQDNGSGIDDHMKEKVFYPNFTTKSSGMGLGLAICSDIIQSFDGKIYFETEKGVGTTFFIELPRHIMNGELTSVSHHREDIAP
ncbi:MAG TPA: HAMP domain-containing sensor histidine kinase [Saprospiraceae bacterium]|nr:HAMP domain-containing sensor histidine kinase [Saprospiraceae bacterium]